MKQENSLVWIEPPKPHSKRTPNVVAQEIWGLYDSGYDLSVADAASILDCKPLWIRQRVLPNVKHIFINSWFRKYMADVRDPAMGIRFLKNFYFFSRTDFYRWVQEHSVATQQTAWVQESDPSRYSPVSFQQRAGSDTPVRINAIPQRFAKLTTLHKRLGVETNEMAYRKLFAAGAVKYRIDDSLVRYNREISLEPTGKQLVWAMEA